MKKKYIKAIILFLVGTYLLAAFDRVLIVHVGEILVRRGTFTQEPFLEILMDWKKLLFYYVPSMYLMTFIFLSTKYFMDYKKVKEKGLVLEKEKSKNELKTLKAQLNPHFLFNTLNNIYSLSVSNSPKTSVSIGKLSEILDHVLYRCNGQFVSLSSEIELLKNYIELEKLRYDDRLQVLFTTNIEEDTEIPPLILLSLVENAFKHGAGEDSGSPKIDIHILNNQKEFTFKISNTISKDYQPKNKESIGLINIRKQLNLIYKNNYNLNIDCSKSTFTVVLNVNRN
ncbi:sensor histidine kinase [Tenacibaculum retecalamus]|uniref:sensor histidine kinase n=1 Tax=Tenacibaculum retecalamus TaxID=3018315 RepID=UPI0023D8E807|nr:histidine kinase [Tenacibaculum retecalamus]WBX71560.1 histidine kinase [Tenacibaculum retecalamus]